MDLNSSEDAAQNDQNHDADDDHADEGVSRHYEDLNAPPMSHKHYSEGGSLPENMANWLLGMIGDQVASSPSLPIVNFYT